MLETPPLRRGISKANSYNLEMGFGQPRIIPKNASHGGFLDALERAMLKGWP